MQPFTTVRMNGGFGPKVTVVKGGDTTSMIFYL